MTNLISLLCRTARLFARCHRDASPQWHGAAWHLPQLLGNKRRGSRSHAPMQSQLPGSPSKSPRKANLPPGKIGTAPPTPQSLELQNRRGHTVHPGLCQIRTIALPEPHGRITSTGCILQSPEDRDVCILMLILPVDSHLQFPAAWTGTPEEAHVGLVHCEPKPTRNHCQNTLSVEMQWQLRNVSHSDGGPHRLRVYITKISQFAFRLISNRIICAAYP